MFEWHSTVLNKLENVPSYTVGSIWSSQNVPHDDLSLPTFVRFTSFNRYRTYFASLFLLYLYAMYLVSVGGVAKSHRDSLRTKFLIVQLTRRPNILRQTERN